MACPTQRRKTASFVKALPPPASAALALLPDAVYETHREDLEAGDVFLLFTDGAVEAESAAGVEFGHERLVGSFGAALDAPLAEVPGRIVGDLTAHMCGRACEDDVCLVAVEAEPVAPVSR